MTGVGGRTWLELWGGFSAVAGLPDWKMIVLFWPNFAIIALIAYLLGSIPFGLILTRLAGLGDIRRVGSGNIGATNVLRTGNKRLAALTLLLDAGKGAAAVLLAGILGPDAVFFAAIAALLGHLFPPWLAFKGGKGLATTLGVTLALDWRVGLAACALWLATAALTRTSSLAALVAVAGAPLVALALPSAQVPTVTLTILFAVLVWVRHHANIGRLLAGNEPRIGGRG